MENISFELENVELSYLDKEIVKIDRLAIHQFDRIGIVGKNGAGKSSLLKLLAGMIQPTSGEVKRHVEFGYLEQIESPSQSEVDEALKGKLAIPNVSDDLSGGEQTRLKLAQLFTNYHEALLIDEPTTHLDREGIEFLKEQLRYYYGALVLISHDRTLLDELVTTIWEIQDGKVSVYSGNYSNYVKQKQLEREQQHQAHEKFMKEKSRLEKAAQEKMKKAEKVAKGSKQKEKPNRMFETKSKGTSEKAVHRAAKAIEQRMEKLHEVEAVKEERLITFKQPKTLELHNKVPIMAQDLTLTAGQKVLLDEVNFQIPLGKKIAITGNNGSGKSTLLRHIAEDGEGITLSPKAKIGMFRQMSYQFTKDETVFDFIKNRSEYEEGFIRSILSKLQFVGNDLRKNVKRLSGGEAIRLQLAELFLGEYNILLLDEPTNFLDIYAIEALETFIKRYKGTIMIVTHDQTFVNRIADVIFQIDDKRIKQI